MNKFYREFNENKDKYKFYLDNEEMDLYLIAEKVFGDWFSNEALEFMSAMWISADNDGGKAEWISKNRLIRGWGFKPRFLGKKRTIDECYKLFKGKN